MHHPLPLLALACTLVACSPAPTPDTPQAPPATKPAPSAAPSPRTERGITQLTVYSGEYEALARVEAAHAGMPGYALVARPLHYTLQAGPNTISATSVPPSMDVEAALLRPQSAGITVQSQRYVAALSGSQDVINRALGNRITVEHTAGGAKQTDNGILLAATDGLTLALGDGRIKVIREYDSFSIVDGTEVLPQQATLHWTVGASKAGEADFLLTYPMGGLAWRAEYLATVATGEGCRLALDGAALVTNRSGVTFTSAKLTLVAGEPRRERAVARPGLRNKYVAADAAAAAPMPTERTSGEYHTYELPGRALRLSDGATERVPLFDLPGAVACERAYVVDAGGPEWQPPQPMLDPDFRGQTGALPVAAVVAVQNTKAAGLGRPLPAGRVRVFDGRDFLGESRLAHTAEGTELRLEVGTAFDLGAERENTGFRVDRAGRTITESFAITLRNAKPGDVTIRVVEPLPRWSDWKILASSVPSQRQDARHAAFAVPVPGGGETRLTYTVQYRWTQGANP